MNLCAALDRAGLAKGQEVAIVAEAPCIYSHDGCRGDEWFLTATPTDDGRAQVRTVLTHRGPGGRHFQRWGAAWVPADLDWKPDECEVRTPGKGIGGNDNYGAERGRGG